MNNGRLGPKSEGSMAFAAMASVLSLSLGSLYVIQTSRQTQQAVDTAMSARASEMGQSSNISNLALIRSLLADRRTADGKGFEPGVYPVNYFANTWNLQKNTNFDLKNVDSIANRVRVKSFSPKDSTIPAVVPIFEQAKTQTQMMGDVQTLEIVALNRSLEFPYYVASVDVKAKRKVSLNSPNNKNKEITSYGRINLSAPIPQEMTLEIRHESDASFSTNFGSKENPLKPGKYALRMKGSGVIHHGEITLNGDKRIVGLDNTGAITHEANSIRSGLTIIGTTTYVDLVNADAEGDDHVKKNECALDVENEVIPGKAPGALTVIAKVIGVDGAEASKLTVKQDVIIGRSGVGTPTHEGGIACESACPPSESGKTYGSEENFASSMDSINRGAKAEDVFEGEKTVEVSAKHGKGIICGNYELAAADMKARSGYNSLSDLHRTNPDLYFIVKRDSMHLKQYTAYMAPSCKPQAVGKREACGCFEEKTIIQMADGSSKLASEIRSGDLVYNPKTQKGQMIKKVIAGPERWPMLEVKAGGKSVIVTGEHPFLTKNGLKQAYQLQAGDVLVEGAAESQVEAVITEDRKEGEKAPEVWNFELIGSSDDEDHYVLANGVMTGDLYLQQKLGGKAARERKIVSE